LENSLNAGRLILSIGCAALLVAPQIAFASWPNNLGGLGEDMIHGMVTDANGNVYVVGEFEGSAVFGSTVLESEGQTDIFVAKFDSNGGSEWASRGGGSSIDRGLAIALDPSGVPYVTGLYSRTAIFEGGLNIGLPKELPDPSGADTDTDALGDLFIGKLDPGDGTWEWLASIETDGFTDEGLAITFLPGAGQTPVDSVVVAASTACPDFFDEEGERTSYLDFGLACGSNPNIVLASIDTLGSWNWAFSDAGSSATSEWVTDLVVDANGDLFVAGEFTADLSIGGTALTLQDVPGSNSTAVLEFDQAYDYKCCLDGATLRYHDGTDYTEVEDSRFNFGGYDDLSRNVWGGYGIRNKFTTQVDLSDFVNSKVSFLWEFADASESGITSGENGWYVDNIRIKRDGKTLYEATFEDDPGPFPFPPLSMLSFGFEQVSCTSSDCRGMESKVLLARDTVTTASSLLAMLGVTIPGDPNHFLARIRNANEGAPEWLWARSVDPALVVEQIIVGESSSGGEELKVVGTAFAAAANPVVTHTGAFVAALPLASGSPWGSSATIGGDRGRAIAAAPDGSVFVAGSYGASGPGGSPAGFPVVNGVDGGTVPVPRDDDVFVAALDADLVPTWLATGGDPDVDSGTAAPDRGRTIAVYDDGVVTQVFVGGEFRESATFFESPTDVQTLTSFSNTNVFLHSLDGQNGAWFFLGLQKFFAGSEVIPPEFALLDHPVLSRPIIEFDAPGSETDYFFWRAPGIPDQLGRLYALQPVEARITWRRIPEILDPTDPPPHNLEQQVLIDWPTQLCPTADDDPDTPDIDESDLNGDSFVDPCRQVHIAGAPVDLTTPGTGISFATVANVQPNLASNAGVNPSRIFSSTTPGFAVLLFADNPAAPDIVAYPPIIEVVQTYESSSAPGFVPNAPCTIGKEIEGGTLHEDLFGRNGFVSDPLALYDPEIYDPASRSGQIIPVNKVNPLTSTGEDDMVVVWYRRNFKPAPLDPYATAEPFFDPTRFVGGIPWGERPVRYDCQWPADPNAIIIASQTGSEVLGQQALDPQQFPLAQIYNQPDRAVTGYNPNDEHAFFAPSNLGTGFDALFAIRSDFFLEGSSTDPSEPFTLLKYFDQNDQKWRFKVYEVIASGAGFGGFLFNGVAATKVSAPYPVSLLGNCSETRGSGSAFFQDYSGAVWAKAEGGMTVKYWYPLQPTFFWSRDTNGPDGVPDGHTEGTGECVPWLDQLPDTPPLEPVAVDYEIVWPDNVPQLVVGETLLRQKRGLPNILDQAAVQIVFDESDPLVADPNVALAQLIDPLSSRTVTMIDVSGTPAEDGSLPKVPLTSKVVTQLDPESGTALLVSNEDGTIRLPSTVRNRTIYDPLNMTLSWRGTLDESGVGEPSLLLNVMSPKDRDLLISLAPGEEDYVHAIRRLFTVTRNPQMLDLDGDCEVDDAYLIGLQDECEGNDCIDDLGFEVSPAKACVEPLFDGTVVADEELKAGDLVRRKLTHGTVSEIVFAQRGDTVAESLGVVGFKPALTAGLSAGTGFMTLAFNNEASLAPLPVSLNVIRVDCLELPDETFSTYQGEIKAIESDNVFDELLTLRHTGDFGGDPSGITFEWFSRPDIDGTPPTPLPDPDNGQLNGWLQFPVNPEGANEITIEGANIQTLSDNWFVVRYKGLNACTNDSRFSVFTGQPGSSPTDVRAQLAPGWVKRVVSGLNPFEARVRDFHAAPTNTYASMLVQLGERYEGDIAFNPAADNLNQIGLIEAYETVLRRAMNLSIGGTPPVNYAPVNNALLLVVSRISDFYMLLGNESWADAQDPMIGFGTSSGAFGSLAPTIFAFQNQLDSLLEEELVLLRGRDDRQGPVKANPVYNRLFWNFTTGEGEVAYSQVYNISDQNTDGFINEFDARILYPQGHGDAWGHYLTAITTYYKLLRHPFFTWIPRPEAVLVAGAPVQVDFLDERKFATVAAAKARAGAEIVDLTYRREYVEDPGGQWQGYIDTDEDRAWGLSGWARRAGQGAYFDWVVGNSVLPPEDTNPDHVGIQKIDRKRVVELDQINGHLTEIQSQLDKADRGLNPLGLAESVVPFDIDPGALPDQTHFEQVYQRAEVALDNAVAVFDHANELNQLLRQNQDTIDDLTRNTTDQERDYNNRMIEVFGYPYSDDIGPGGTYPEGYNGPDVYHWMYVDQSDLTGTIEEPVQVVTASFSPTLTIGNFNFDPDPKLGCLLDPRATFCSLSEPPDVALDVDYHLSTSANTLGLIKPPQWTGQRRATGEVQDRLSDFFVALNSYNQILKEYDNLVEEIKGAVDDLEVNHQIRSSQIKVEHAADELVQRGNEVLAIMEGTKIVLQRTAQFLDASFKNTKECLPDVAIAGTAAGGDMTSMARCTIAVGGSAAAFALDTIADGIDIAKLPIEQLQNRIGMMAGLSIKVLEADQATAEAVGELETMWRKEPLLRLEAFTRREVVEQQQRAVLQALAKGQRLLSERVQFRKNTAADVQEHRFQDMAFRIFRNDSLQKYRAQFDLAARYAFLAATAYDYETNLLGSNPQSGQDFLTNIVRQRSLGQLVDGNPIAGSPGLADPMARLRQNFDVLKGQLGFNNPQTETNRFSLRSELFRLKDDTPESEAKWRQILEDHKVDDLFTNELFRRYARPFAPEELGAQPGIIIPFSTTVTFAMNFFGWPLGPGDSAYDPSNFATKVRSVGVWFEDYDQLPLSTTPRVYLIPVGADVLRSPDATDFGTREWSVVDQRLPVPFPIGAENLDDPDWIPVNDGLSEDFYEIRRFSSFKAYSLTDGEPIDVDEMTTDSRLIGRSVWNTRWLLVIPGGTMLFDPEGGLDIFIGGQLIPGGGGDRDGNGVKDITFFFQTYAYSGN
jgi:hypothetical protein